MISDRLTTQENQIISLLIAGDESGISILYDKYGGALNTIILKIVSDKELSREILQDVFIKIWNNIESYSAEKSKFFTWMARIAKNSAIDATRSKGFKKNTKTDSIDNSVGIFESGSEAISVDNIGLKELLSHLDDDHRKIIDLLYFQDYTQTEVEKELGIPLGTVKTRSRRAIQKLRDHLRGDIFISIILFIGTLFLLLSKII